MVTLPPAGTPMANGSAGFARRDRSVSRMLMIMADFAPRGRITSLEGERGARLGIRNLIQRSGGQLAGVRKNSACGDLSPAANQPDMRNSSALRQGLQGSSNKMARTSHRARR